MCITNCLLCMHACIFPCEKVMVLCLTLIVLQFSTCDILSEACSQDGFGAKLGQCCRLVACSLSIPIWRCFHKWGHLKTVGFNTKMVKVWMIWGTIHFRKQTSVYSIHVKLKWEALFLFVRHTFSRILLALPGTVCLEDSRGPTGGSRFAERPGCGVTRGALVNSTMAGVPDGTQLLQETGMAAEAAMNHFELTDPSSPSNS